MDCIDCKDPLLLRMSSLLSIRVMLCLERRYFSFSTSFYFFNCITCCDNCQILEVSLLFYDFNASTDKQSSSWLNNLEWMDVRRLWVPLESNYSFSLQSSLSSGVFEEFAQCIPFRFKFLLAIFNLPMSILLVSLSSLFSLVISSTAYLILSSSSSLPHPSLSDLSHSPSSNDAEEEYRISLLIS